MGRCQFWKVSRTFGAVQHLPFQMPPLGRMPEKIKKGHEVAESETCHMKIVSLEKELLLGSRNPALRTLVLTLASRQEGVWRAVVGTSLPHSTASQAMPACPCSLAQPCLQCPVLALGQGLPEQSPALVLAAGGRQHHTGWLGAMEGIWKQELVPTEVWVGTSIQPLDQRCLLPQGATGNLVWACLQQCCCIWLWLQMEKSGIHSLSPKEERQGWACNHCLGTGTI